MTTIPKPTAELNALDLATPEERAEFWQGYEEWLDRVEAAFPLPARVSLLNRIQWACTLSLKNLVRLAEDGLTFLVASRSQRGKEWRVNEVLGCHCPDYKTRHICAHWLSVGEASNGAFLIARIERAQSLDRLEEVKAEWLAIDDPKHKACPPELEAFAAMEYHRRRRALLTN
jgi:hypothetical protein